MQYNIYIRRDNWEKFKNEDKKAELINRLLSAHYGRSKDAVPAKPTKDVDQVNTEVAVAAWNDEEVCPGHDIRMNCGRKGCIYANR